MNNPHEGLVEVVLDKPRTLKFTTRALAGMTKAIGCDWRKFVQRFAWSADEMAIASRIKEGDLEPDAEESLKLIQIMNDRMALDLEELAQLLRLGLLHESPELTVDDCFELIDQADGEHQELRELRIRKAVLEAFFTRAAPQARPVVCGAHDALIQAAEALLEASRLALSEELPSDTDSLPALSGV